MNERTQQEVNSERASEAPGTLEQRAESLLPSRCVVGGASSLIYSLWVEGRGVKLDSLFTLVTENIFDVTEKERKTKGICGFSLSSLLSANL